MAYEFRLADEQIKSTSPELAMITDDLWDPAVLERVYEQVRTMKSILPNDTMYFDAKEVVERPREVANTFEAWVGGDLATPFVEHMRRLVVDHFPSFFKDGGRYLTLWTRLEFVPNNTLSLHFDHNGLEEQTVGMKFPLWASVFHLGPKAGVEGGATYVSSDPPVNDALRDVLWEDITLERLHSLNLDLMAIPRKQNRLLVFRGDRAHAIGPISKVDPKHPRIVLLCNGMTEPFVDLKRLHKGISVLTPEELKLVQKVQIRDIFQLLRIRSLAPLEDLIKVLDRFG